MRVFLRDLLCWVPYSVSTGLVEYLHILWQFCLGLYGELFFFMLQFGVKFNCKWVLVWSKPTVWSARCDNHNSMLITDITDSDARCWSNSLCSFLSLRSYSLLCSIPYLFSHHECHPRFAAFLQHHERMLWEGSPGCYIAHNSLWLKLVMVSHWDSCWGVCCRFWVGVFHYWYCTEGGGLILLKPYIFYRCPRTVNETGYPKEPGLQQLRNVKL